MKLLKRLLISALLYTVFLQPTLVYARGFLDLMAGHKHYVAVNSLVEKGVIDGYPDGTFRSAKTINRAEAVKILVEANYADPVIADALKDHVALNHAYVNFPDVALDQWFSPHVEVSFQNYIVDGYPDGTFKPANAINMAEALKVILNTYQVDTNGITFSPSKLLLVQPGEWFTPYFAYAQSVNLLNPNKFYHPGQLITRGEFVEIIYRLQEIQSKQLARFPQPQVSSNEYSITIPRLNIVDQQISFANPYDAEGALNLLRKFPFGHYLAAPGSGRKFVLFGHSSGYAWDQSPYKVVLRNIDQLQAGDLIYINYQEKGYVYQIFKTAVIPENLDSTILADSGSDELAVYTCWPPDSTVSRYVVYGKPAA